MNKTFKAAIISVFNDLKEKQPLLLVNLNSKNENYEKDYKVLDWKA